MTLDKIKNFFKEKYYISEIIITILLFFIIIMLTTDIFNLGIYNYNSFQIEIKYLVTTFLFLMILPLKNINKVKMLYVLNRFNQNVLITMIVYNLIPYIMMLLLVITNSVNPLLAILIIINELILLIINFYINYENKAERDILPLVIFKEFHFALLVIILLMSNYPFTIINIPLSMFVIISYIILQINLIYNISSKLKKGE